MTQDNTPPGPTFKVRLLGTKDDPDTKRRFFGKLGAGEIFPTTTLFGTATSHLGAVFSPAVKLGYGGVFSCCITSGASFRADDNCFLTLGVGSPPPPSLPHPSKGGGYHWYCSFITTRA